MYESPYATFSQCIDCDPLKMAHCRGNKKCMTLQCPFSGHEERKFFSLAWMPCRGPRPSAGSYLLHRERPSISHIWCVSLLRYGPFGSCETRVLEVEQIKFFYTACHAASHFGILLAALGPWDCLPDSYYRRK